MRSIRRWIRRPSPGTAIGCIALMVALGGTANALDGVNTVENNDMQNDSVGHKNLKTDSVRRAEIKAGAVQNEELGNIVERDGSDVEIVDTARDGDWTVGGNFSQAQCREGEKLMGGTLEWDSDGGVRAELHIVKMFPHFEDNLRTWTAQGASDTGLTDRFHAVAFCLQ